MGTKVCFRCKTELSLDLFGTDLTKKDGVSSYCRKCNFKREQEYKLKVEERKNMSVEQLIAENKRLSPVKKNKTCKKCEVNKSIYEFYISKAGYASSTCIECNKIGKKRRYNTKGRIEDPFDDVIEIHKGIRAGLIPELSPEEEDAENKRLKILNYREWTFDFVRLKQISDELYEKESAMRTRSKRTKLENQGVDTDGWNDDEIENYFNI